MNKMFCRLFLVLTLCVCAYVQGEPLSEENLKVNTIKINLLGYTNVSESFIRSRLPFKEGDEIYGKDLQTMSSILLATGWVDSLNYECNKDASGDLDLVLSVHICPRVSGIQILGNKKFSANELIHEMGSRVHEPLNRQRLQVDCQRLEKFYRQKGFCDVKVNVSTQKEERGYEKIIVNINEGARFKIKAICFRGIKAVKEADLLKILQTKTWGWLSWFTNSGYYREEVLLQDISTLQEYYKNLGYLDVEIDRSNVKIERNGEALRIIFDIDEGTKYTVGDIVVVSEESADDKILKDSMPLKKGDAAGPENIENACEFIRDFYGKSGYVASTVNVQRSLAGADKIDLKFYVKKGLQYHINSIYITGNIHTQAKVVLRELNLAPGDLLDRERMKRAEQRLQNTGFFKNVLVTAEDCNVACQKNLKVAVEENKTGSVFFSGGVNSVEKFTFGVTLSQNNFDYKNSKDYYRGAGQKFQLGLTLGHNTNSVDLMFEEPWLFDRELRFGFNLFRTMNKLSDADYKEQRLGGEVYLGKRLFEQVEGKLYYHLEQFKLTNVKHNVSEVIRREAGSRIISKVGFLMERDTRNGLFYPTKGSYLAWDNQLAGLGGKTKYFRTKFTAARWFLVSPEKEQTFLVGGKCGVIKGLGGKHVPLFEREFLGGPDDLRGFDYREVGPKSDDRYKENLGGKSFAFLKTEYSIKVHPIVRVIGFWDVGHVSKFDYTPVAPRSGGVNSDAGMGLRIHVLGVPFRLDFAFPLKTDAYNKKKAPYIVYSFGVSF